MSALDRASRAIHETERRLGAASAAQFVAEHLLSLRAARGADPRLHLRIAIALDAAREATDQAEQARQQAITELAGYAASAGGGS